MRATKETTAGRKYLELQREARRTGRPTDELIQLYAMQCCVLQRYSSASDPIPSARLMVLAVSARS